MEARTLFRTRCAVCHGDVGKGDGPGAAALNPKPRAFADAAWQQATTDDALRTIIVQGGPAVGKNAAMPPNPDLVSKPAVVVELTKIVRGFAPK
jgi:mono/diheme cytochrome c family protein